MDLIYINTNGCIEAKLYSKRVERFFKVNNWGFTKDPTKADIIIFYACGLTKFDEESSLGIIRKLQMNMKPTARLIVWGCLPKQNPQSLSSVYDGPLIGPLDTDFFARALENTIIQYDNIEHAAGDDELESMKKVQSHKMDPVTRSIIFFKSGWDKACTKKMKKTEPFYIQIASGCEGQCTYCNERNVFGGIKSRPINNIISEFQKGLQLGYNRFSLVATDLGVYGKDINYSLSDLIRNMMRSTDKANYSIILNQMEPFHLKEQYPDLEEIFSSGKIEEFMCPVQSGSNRILELMKRRYTAEEWRNYMLKIHKKFPNIRLNTHFLIGFPTETEEDFKATLKLLDPPLFIESFYSFKYSNRPNVYSSSFSGQVPDNIKELRYVKLAQKYAFMYVFNFMRENKVTNFLVS